MLMASVCNPIFINTFVVFIRLYWFEKRFQNVVLEARTMRRHRTRSRTKSEAKGDTERDVGREEQGVGDREIKVLRAANGEATGKKIVDEDDFYEEADKGSPKASNSANDDAEASEDASPREDAQTPLHRDITFADEVASPSDRIPQRHKEQSIAFVENQRNPRDKGTYRIPGPRDYDLGFVPQRIEEGDDLEHAITDDADGQRMRRQRSNSIPPVELNEDDHPLKQHITIDAPGPRPRPHTGTSAYNFRGRTSESGEVPTAAMSLRNRARSRTLASFLTRDKEEEKDPMPYLSWTPTVGRNSAFVDLTEDQREELGGIEYRALKLLAIILVCYFVGFHLLGMICLLPWIVRDQKYSDVALDAGVSPVWW